MSADELLRAGRLDDATAALKNQVRSDPANAKLRIFLFQILAVQGDWERALTQLNVAAEMEPAALAMAQMYREAIRCELLRNEVFAGKRTPLVFGQPGDWVGLLLESLRLTAQENYAAAAKLRDQAYELAPVTPGRIDGQPFEWLADADTRIGPMVEAVVNGRYYWIPVENIRQIDFEEPQDLRDFVWTPVHFTWTNGGEMVGVVPTRYPGSEADADEAVRLARKTTWLEKPDGTALGLGQRILVTDQDEYSLLDIRKIEFGCDDASEAAAAAGETGINEQQEAANPDE